MSANLQHLFQEDKVWFPGATRRSSWFIVVIIRHIKPTWGTMEQYT